MRIQIYVQRLLLVIIAVALLGCASPKNYSDAIHSWNGVPVQFLLKRWGPPTAVSTLANGRQFYLYVALEQRSFPSQYGPGYARTSPQGDHVEILNKPAKAAPHYIVSFWCDTGFEINKKGVIVNTVFRGNNCVTTEGGATRLMSEN